MEKAIKNGMLVIYLAGDLVNEATNARVKEEVLQSLEAGIKNIVLNLSKVDFLNSSGM